MKFCVLMSGPPGCGKSTLSKRIAKALKLTHLDKDCIDEPFSPSDRGAHYTSEVEPKVLQALLNLAKVNLENDQSVILDVPWTHILIETPEWVEKIQSLVRETRSTLCVFDAVISEEDLRERIKARGLDRDQVKLTAEGWAQFKKSDHLGEKNPFPHTPLDFSKSIEELEKIAVKSIYVQGAR